MTVAAIAATAFGLYIVSATSGTIRKSEHITISIMASRRAARFCAEIPARDLLPRLSFCA